jgi:hypothetical protein
MEREEVLAASVSEQWSRWVELAVARQVSVSAFR